MNGRKFRYNGINIVAFLVATVLFIYEYKNLCELFNDCTIRQMLTIFATVIIVHIIKAARLYLALYGSEISFKEYIKIYCKVTPVSMIIPYKLGELFRMFCYGEALNNMIRGSVIVILDRFMDTIALITMIILIYLFNGGHITSLVYVLMIFLTFVLIVYFVFPGVYRFWKHYMLRAKATERKLSILKLLSTMNHVYEEIKGVSKGRGIILYFMSLAAWAVEIGSVVLQRGVFSSAEIFDDVAAYLSTAMGNNSFDILRMFVFVSVVVMMTLYLIVKNMELFSRKKVRE